MKNYTRIIVAVTLLFGLSVAAKAAERNRNCCNSALPVCGQGKDTPCRHLHGEAIVD